MDTFLKNQQIADVLKRNNTNFEDKDDLQSYNILAEEFNFSAVSFDVIKDNAEALTKEKGIFTLDTQWLKENWKNWGYAAIEEVCIIEN